MKTILQKGEYDCGVACVAMLAGISYDDALAVVFPNGRAGKTKTSHLRESLRKLGRRPADGRRRPVRGKPLESLENDALLMVEIRDGKRRYRHWIVWDRVHQKKRDPYRPTKPHKELSYLLVE